MIVWGGDESRTPLDTRRTVRPGDRQRGPPTSTADAPIARNRHTAVWTGTEMIVWGGTESPTEYNTGGRYDPVTDTLDCDHHRRVRRSPAMNHTAVWTGTEMIVWGGFTGSVTEHRRTLRPGHRHLGRDDLTGMPSGSARYHTAVWTGTEMIVWGGGDRRHHTRTPAAATTRRPTAGRRRPSPERPDRPRPPHGGLDRHRDDRLGRMGR